MNETDKQWIELLALVRERLNKHECKVRMREDDDLPAVNITTEKKEVSTTEWVLEDNYHFEPSDEPDVVSSEVKFIKVECSYCNARLVGGWNFRNIEDGSVRNIDAPFLADAWKILESDYSDPIHAVEDWVMMEGAST